MELVHGCRISLLFWLYISKASTGTPPDSLNLSVSNISASGARTYLFGREYSVVLRTGYSHIRYGILYLVRLIVLESSIYKTCRGHI